MHSYKDDYRLLLNKNEEGSVVNAQWARCSTDQIARMQRSVAAAKTTRAYRLLHDHFWKTALLVASVLTLTFLWGVAQSTAEPPSPNEWPLAVQLALLSIVVLPAFLLCTGVLTSIVQELLFNKLNKLERWLSPLAESGWRCETALKLCQECPDAQAHRLAVIESGRELLLGDLQHMEALAFEHRTRRREAQQRELCRQLHLGVSETSEAPETPETLETSEPRFA